MNKFCSRSATPSAPKQLRYPARARALAVAAALLVGFALLVGEVASASTLPGGYTLSVIAGRAPVISGTSATKNLLGVYGTAVDSGGNMFIADMGGYVERVTPGGTLSIIAGNGRHDLPKAGPAKASPMSPDGVAVDSSGNVYISDYAGYVMKVTPGGRLSIIAGNGSGNIGNPRPGPATLSPMNPLGVAVDSARNVYIVDRSSWTQDHGRYVLKVTPSGTLSIVAGNGRIGKPKAGVATSSPLSPTAVAVDSGRNLYIGDGQGYVVKVTRAGLLLPIAGNGTIDRPVPGPAQASPVSPQGVAVDSTGNVYIADNDGHRTGYVDKVSTTGVLSVVAGNGSRGVVKPGAATSTVMDPQGVAVDRSGNVYIASYDNHALLLKVTSGGALSIVAGAASPTPGSARFSVMSPGRVVVDSSGDVYLTDGLGYVDKVTPDGVLSIVAGNGDFAHQPVAGSATASPMRPVGLALDSAGNLYIADELGYVEKVTSAGVLSIVAGNGMWASPVPGAATASPLYPTDVAVDSSGNLYITDGVGHVSRVTPTGTLSNFAGNGTEFGTPVTGPATSSHVFADSVTTDALGNVYLAELNGYVYKVTPAGMLSIVAGNGDPGRTAVAGMAVSSPIAPGDIALDRSGNLFITDWNGYLEKVSPAGVLSIVGGHGSKLGLPDGYPSASSPPSSGPWEPGGIATDSSHDLYMVDLGLYLDKLTPGARPRPLTSQAKSVSFGSAARVGAKLTARVSGSWVAGSRTLAPRYQWYTVSGSTWIPIRGATARTYTPPRSLRGKHLGVKAVGASPPGYVTATPVSSHIVAIS